MSKTALTIQVNRKLNPRLEKYQGFENVASYIQIDDREVKNKLESSGITDKLSPANMVGIMAWFGEQFDKEERFEKVVKKIKGLEFDCNSLTHYCALLTMWGFGESDWVFELFDEDELKRLTQFAEYMEGEHPELVEAFRAYQLEMMTDINLEQKHLMDLHRNARSEREKEDTQKYYTYLREQYCHEIPENKENMLESICLEGM